MWQTKSPCDGAECGVCQLLPYFILFFLEYYSIDVFSRYSSHPYKVVVSTKIDAVENRLKTKTENKQHETSKRGEHTSSEAGKTANSR